MHLGARLAGAWDWLFGGRSADDEFFDNGANDDWSRAEAAYDGRAAAPSRGRQGLGVAAALAFVLLPAWQMVRGDGPRTTYSAQSPAAAKLCLERAVACDKEFLPEQIGDLTSDRFFAQERSRDDLFGNFSRGHEYRDPHGNLFLVSCDFPYEGGWHELTTCYLGVGWDVEGRDVVDEHPGGDSAGWHRLEASFSRPDGSKAFLTASAFDEFGRPIELPSSSFWANVWRTMSLQRDVIAHKVAFQIQVWTTSTEPIDEQAREAARQTLIEARTRFRDIVVPGERSVDFSEESAAVAAPSS